MMFGKALVPSGLSRSPTFGQPFPMSSMRLTMTPTSILSDNISCHLQPDGRTRERTLLRRIQILIIDSLLRHVDSHGFRSDLFAGEGAGTRGISE